MIFLITMIAMGSLAWIAGGSTGIKQAVLVALAVLVYGIFVCNRIGLI